MKNKIPYSANELYNALKESLALQSYYVKLLGGGKTYSPKK